MALTPQAIVNEVSRLADSASVSDLRRLDTNAHIVAAISLLHSASGGGISTEIDDSLDIQSIKTSLESILAELVTSNIRAQALSAVLGSALAVEQVVFASNKLAAAFALPDPGNVGVLALQPVAESTSSLYKMGDVILLSEIDNGGLLIKGARLKILTEPDNNNISVRTLSGDASMGSLVFPIGSEVSGQTRLPNIPANASSAFLSPVLTLRTRSASSNRADPMNAIAQGLVAGDPLIYIGLKTDQDIDLDSRYGVCLSHGGFWGSTTKSDLEQWRGVAVTPHSLLPSMEVVYR